MNKFNPDNHHRRSIRLKGYDYSQNGLYFITICTHGRINLFGTIEEGVMNYNRAGGMIEQIWNSMPERYPQMELYSYIVMPNHFHAILGLYPNSANPLNNRMVGNIIGAFKSITTREYMQGMETLEWTPFNQKLWQRNFYEHIIRNDIVFNKITEYINITLHNGIMMKTISKKIAKV